MIHSLSSAQLQLVTDSTVLLQKNKIIKEVVSLFGTLAENYKNSSPNVMTTMVRRNAKISKGENYQGLPYVMLDYPREFEKANVFAIRSFFWWGHYFSITLHLEGEYLKLFQQRVQLALHKNRFGDWFRAADADPWQHNIEYPGYIAVTPGDHLQFEKTTLFKLAKKIPLRSGMMQCNFL